LVFAAATAAVCVALPGSADATFPGQNGRIAYTKHALYWEEGGSDEGPVLDSFPHVFTLNPDGSVPRRLVGYAEEPRFSAGGSFVAFEDYLERVFLRPTSGGRRRRLNPRLRGIDVQGDPAWSPSGQTLVFVLERSDGLYLHRIRRDGTAMHRLRAGIEPDWSIRNRIVFDGGRRIATMAPGGGRLHRLRPGGSPRWSPDGRWIVFSRALARGRSGIAIMRADGSHLRTLTRGPWDASPVWSPEGRHIAYVHRNRRKARERIVVMRTDGKRRRAILSVRRHPQLSDLGVMLEDLDWQPLPV
jgi:Tol biopolymer transport system component